MSAEPTTARGASIPAEPITAEDATGPAEPITTQGTTVATEPGHQLADDESLRTEEPYQDPDPGADSETATAAETETAPETETTSNPVVRTRLLTDDAEQAFLSRWTEIQVGFVEDPAGAVRDAEKLIDEIAAAWQAAFRARRDDLAADWRDGSAGTEELRLALRRYRAFVGVVLPK